MYVYRYVVHSSSATILLRSFSKNETPQKIRSQNTYQKVMRHLARRHRFLTLSTTTRCPAANRCNRYSSGLPKQTVEQWEHTLVEAISTGAAHISVYDLQVTDITS